MPKSSKDEALYRQGRVVFILFVFCLTFVRVFVKKFPCSRKEGEGNKYKKFDVLFTLSSLTSAVGKLCKTGGARKGFCAISSGNIFPGPSISHS